MKHTENEIKEIEEQKQSYVKEGLEQTALNMLKESIDINIISKVTGLNISQIKELESNWFYFLFLTKNYIYIWNNKKTRRKKWKIKI